MGKEIKCFAESMVDENDKFIEYTDGEKEKISEKRIHELWLEWNKDEKRNSIRIDKGHYSIFTWYDKYEY